MRSLVLLLLLLLFSLLFGRLFLLRFLLLLDISPLQDRLLLGVLLDLPVLHLHLVARQLFIQLLNECGDVVGRNGRVELELIEELESLRIVLDRLGLAATVAAALVLRLRLLLGRWGEIVILLALVLAQENHVCVGVVVLDLLLLDLLGGPLVSYQALAEQKGLLDQSNLSHVRLDVHLLRLADASCRLPLRLLPVRLLRVLLLLLLALLVLPRVELPLLLAEGIPQDVALVHLILDLLAELRALLDVLW